MHDRRGERRTRPFDDMMDEPVSKRATLGVFSRLSGASVKGVRRESFDHEEQRGATHQKVRRSSIHISREEGDTEDSNTFRPAIASSITRTGGEKTRAEAAVAVTDKASVSRNKRMFGALLGTLQSFRKDEAKQKDKEEQRQAVEKKLEERGEKMREEMAAERRRQWEEKKQKEVHQRKLAEHQEKVKELDKWIVYQLKLCNFIKTDSSPNIFWLPKISSRAAEKAQKSTRDKLTEEIYERKAKLEDELKELMSFSKKSSQIDRNNSDVESEYEYRTTLVRKGKELTRDLTSRLGSKEEDSPPKKGEALGRMVVRVGGGFGSERVVEVGQKKTIIKPEDMRDIKIKVERERDGGEEKENRKILLKKDTKRRSEEEGRRVKSPLRRSGKEETNKEDKDFDDEVSRMRKRIVEKARKMTEEKNKKGKLSEEKNKKGKMSEVKKEKTTEEKKFKMNGHNKDNSDKTEELEDGLDDMTEASKSVFHDDILNMDEEEETEEPKETIMEVEKTQKSKASKDKKSDHSNVENRSSRHSSHSESFKNGENKFETNSSNEMETELEKKSEGKASKVKKSATEIEGSPEPHVAKSSPKKHKLADDKSPNKGNKSSKKQKSPKKKSPVKKDSRGSSSSEESSSDSGDSSSSDSSESSGGESSSEGESSEEERSSDGKKGKSSKEKRAYKDSDSEGEQMRRPPQKRKRETERSADRKRR